jgi:hypothetical protein
MIAAFIIERFLLLLILHCDKRRHRAAPLRNTAALHAPLSEPANLQQFQLERPARCGFDRKAAVRFNRLNTQHFRPRFM